jgi:hypothetical protein
MPIMDAATIWAAVGAVGAVAAAGIAAWAARQSHDAATQANAAAGTLAAIDMCAGLPKVNRYVQHRAVRQVGLRQRAWKSRS